jgi:hypothetical protein
VVKRPFYFRSTVSEFECFIPSCIKKVLDLIGDESKEYEDGREFICWGCNDIVDKKIQNQGDKAQVEYKSKKGVSE